MSVGRPARADAATLRQTQFRLPAELLEALDAAARERSVSRNWLVERLLVEAVDRLIPVDEIPLTRRSDG